MGKEKNEKTVFECPVGRFFMDWGGFLGGNPSSMDTFRSRGLSS